MSPAIASSHAEAASIPARAGIGLRLPHHALAVAGDAPAAWLEVHAENYFEDHAARAELRVICGHCPLSIHAVGLSLGSAHGLDVEHLTRFRDLVAELRPGLISDHLSWSRAPGVYLPDLLPLPYTQEALSIFARNLDAAQNTLGRPLLIENPSTYLEFAGSPLGEARFLAELVRLTGCGVLLDVNNIHVSACNRRRSPTAMLDEYLAALNPRSIGELHLAGHATLQTESGRTWRIDDHGSAVCAEVWSLYERTLAFLGPRPTLIEWDTRIPAFAVLAQQAAEAQWRLDSLEMDRARAG